MHARLKHLAALNNIEAAASALETVATGSREG
jgi:hypothetical protein